jgi:diguanylate cyclase (GGDEF)-like protein/PAS domain S-box-containing protein
VDSFLDSFHSGHLVVNSKRAITYSNKHLLTLLGWKKEELSSMPLSNIFTKASNIFIDSYVYPLLINEFYAEEVQLTVITYQGKKVPVVASISLDKEHTTYWSLLDCSNRDKLYQELIETKELLEKQSQELLEMATIDPLTGLLNRRELNNRSGRLFSQAQRNKSSVALMIIDIDYFKNINDTYGHAFGDDVLQHLGKTLLKSHREHDVVARYGGEEFVLVLPDIDDANALNIAEKIRCDIETTKINGVNITVSIGVSINKDNKNEFDVLFKEADSALFKAKKNGRNRAILY